MTCVVITPNSPLIFRDPKPFDTGAGGAVSLPFPTPSAVAGTLRTAIVRKANNDDFPQAMADTVVNWKFQGPLLRVGSEVYVPAPADAYPEGGAFHRLRPVELPGAGCNLPGGLKPVGLPLNSKAGKPEYGKACDFWKVTDLASQWLIPGGESIDQSSIGGISLERDRRTHVAIGGNYAGVPGMLFSTEAIDFQGKEVTTGLVVKIVDTGNTSADGLNGYTHRIGGEGRFADFSVVDAWPTVPPTWKTTVESATQLCMVLVTPAIYAGGWRPHWIDPQTFKGKIPGTQTEVELVGARIPRWKPLAGWEIKRRLENGKWIEGGPKPLRRMTPAGSVYFFEKVDNTEVNPDALWLASSMSDGDAPESNGLANLKHDGFGLAVWGAW
ncbi:MAG: hypothetical protein IT350_05340 [Deltaproteobacteria bacterium]|nr:hypothetical protein [Deltaproteobacteria bacterium]